MTISYDNLAPVVLFAFNRPYHTLKVLEGLSRNFVIKYSKLYIFCDGPKQNSSKQEVDKINELRKVIRQEEWSREVEIIERSSNLGLDKSIINGTSYVLEKHDKVIVLEDDNVPSPFFLQFMNEALNIYADMSNIYQVSGYFFPIPQLKNTTALLPIISSWGWGTWKKKWEIFKFDFPSVQLLEESKYLKHRFNLGNLEFYEYMLDKKSSHWDVFFYLEVFKRNGLSVFPRKSLIKNIGFDGTGVNCLKDDNFDQDFFNGQISVVKEDQIDLKFYGTVAKYFESNRKIDQCINYLEKLKKKKFTLFKKS